MNWLTYALLSALFAGLVAIFGKIGMREIDSTFATAARAVIMTIALLLLLGIRGGTTGWREITPRTWFYITLAGVAGASSWLCYFRALQLGEASRVASIDRLSILVAVVGSVILFGEKLSVGGMCGVLLILIGSILIARG